MKHLDIIMNDNYENLAIGFYGFINDTNKNISKMYNIIILLIFFLFIFVVIIIFLLLKNNKNQNQNNKFYSKKINDESIKK